MSTLKPNLIRADTLDLQDHDTPSASDHGRNPHPAPVGAGPAAPHQQQTLRNLDQGRSAEQDQLADSWGSRGSSGRSSHEGSELLDQDTRTSTDDTRIDDGALEQNNDDASSADGDGEEMLESDRSSSPSIDDNEDIDPDFVYALHNFIATVEGQANAAKGDSMVLLDDTNSYWWLVRLVKDSSIGYLPAEHIELPVEREARQNKHRNLELARMHLTDDPGKSKNPLKKAMRRRNAKKVDFSTPTFYEASEVEWSDEETGEDQEHGLAAGHAQTQQHVQQHEDADGIMVDQTYANGQGATFGLDAQSENAGQTSNSQVGIVEWTQGADEDMAQKTSRVGTIRNTDSFFGGDAEPRKISLTPNLLREESGSTSARSSDSTDKTNPNSDIFAELEKAPSNGDKVRDDKKRKDKKPGMLSGLFKRKDKKIKVDEAAGGTVVKHETEPPSPTTPTTTGESSPMSATSPASPQGRRSTGANKLTKPPPAGLFTSPDTTPKSPIETSFTPGPQLTQPARDTSAPMQGIAEEQSQPSAGNIEGQASETRSRNDSSSASSITPAPLKFSRPVETAQQRQDSPAVYDDPANLQQQNEVSQTSVQPGPYREYEPGTGTQATPIVPIGNVPELQRSRAGTDTSTSASAESSSRTVSPASPAEENAPQLEHSALTLSNSALPSQSPQKSQWDNVALRNYLDDRGNQDAKDLLLLVNDTTGVKPLPLDHPVMLGFGFHEHQRQLNDMSQRLDAMLNGFLARTAARPKTQRVPVVSS